MERTEVVINHNNRGEIQLFTDDQKAGKMDIAIAGGKLIVYHTEVNPAHEGKGFARLLLDKLVSHAREHALKIVPLCPYVYAQFKRHPETYMDIWFNEHDQD
ncbi:GNAT family N-acetyltransferase [Parapedobacter lycopersici]|uniref:GNAT family N-acetyltransferase n=1 Tax=Parapedobacter lycopersici TaxID=1864939 RepID=UPI00214D585D|nr:GNAT family N-acetyltransferase [Parapedobacter lycopersici]